MMKHLFFLIVFIVFCCHNVCAQSCKKKWIEGYVVYYRDSIGHQDEDVEIDHSGFAYYFEKEISFDVINNYFTQNDTFQFTTIGEPWDGYVYIDDNQREHYNECLKSEGLTREKCRSIIFFPDKNIPDFFIRSNCKLISVFKFTGEVITNFTAQNFINRYRAQTLIILPNEKNKLEYLFSIIGSCPVDLEK